MTPIASGRVPEALRRGELDLALLDDAVHDPQLKFRPMGRLQHDVFVAPSHALAAEGRLRAAQLEEVAFVAPPPDARGHTPDAWPDHRPRRVGLRVSQMQLGLDATASGEFAIVVPRVVGEQFGLVRLRVWFTLPPTELVLAHRAPLAIPSDAERVADILVADGQQPAPER